MDEGRVRRLVSVSASASILCFTFSSKLVAGHVFVCFRLKYYRK